MAATKGDDERVKTGRERRRVSRAVTTMNNNGTLGVSIPADVVDWFGVVSNDQLSMVICDRGVWIPHDQ